MPHSLSITLNRRTGRAVASFHGSAVPAWATIRKVKTARVTALTGIAYTSGLQSH